jgi:hypothetical protein
MEVTLRTLDTGAGSCGWSMPRAVRCTPGNKSDSNLTGDWVGLSRCAWTVKHPPSFEPRTVQPVVICTNYAVQAVYRQLSYCFLSCLQHT